MVHWDLNKCVKLDKLKFRSSDIAFSTSTHERRAMHRSPLAVSAADMSLPHGLLPNELEFKELSLMATTVQQQKGLQRWQEKAAEEELYNTLSYVAGYFSVKSRNGPIGPSNELT